MIREERFFGKMMEKVPSVQEETEPRGYRVALRKKSQRPPQVRISAAWGGSGIAGDVIGEVETPALTL